MSSNPTVNLVLHAHLPYVVGHGRWPHGTDWLSEAVVETYLPLHRLFTQLADSGRGPRVTLGLTPILCEQLVSAPFQEELASYLNLKCAAAEQDAQYFAAEGRDHRAHLARRWDRRFEEARRHLDEIDWNLVEAFRRLEERGAIEIMTSAATHGYLPLLSRQSAIRAQIRAGIEAHQRHFGRRPRGFWLPECGYRPGGPWEPAVGSAPAVYRPGIELFLAPYGIRYFVVDTHLVAGPEFAACASSSGLHPGKANLAPGLTAPARSPAGQPPSAGSSPYRRYRVGAMTAFARDPKTSRLVWSARDGYPGDSSYLEFHKRHHPGGLRYWAVTGRDSKLEDKQEYDEEAARRRTREQAEHFVGVLNELGSGLLDEVCAPSIVAPYDAELFGHWWFEGPSFLGEALERLASHPGLRLATLGESLQVDQVRDIDLPEGSWGEGGGHDSWLNQDTRHLWRLIYEAEEKMERLARNRAQRAGLLETRVLRQLGRTLLLLEASDWTFLLTAHTASDYAERRVREHYEDFGRLYSMARHLIGGGPPLERDLETLGTLEKRDAVFPEVAASWWC